MYMYSFSPRKSLKFIFPTQRGWNRGEWGILRYYLIYLIGTSCRFHFLMNPYEPLPIWLCQAKSFIYILVLIFNRCLWMWRPPGLSLWLKTVETWRIQGSRYHEWTGVYIIHIFLDLRKKWIIGCITARFYHVWFN